MVILRYLHLVSDDEKHTKSAMNEKYEFKDYNVGLCVNPCFKIYQSLF